MVSDATRFRIETDTLQWLDHINVRGSKENQLFLIMWLTWADSENSLIHWAFNAS